MFNITKRDVAWGTAIASIITVVAFVAIINSLVNQTASALVTGVKVQRHVVQGIAETNYWLRKPSEVAQAEAKATMLSVVK